MAVELALLLIGTSTHASTFDLEALITEALKRHPALVRARRDLAASKQVPSRVSSLPDPVLSAAVSNFRVDDPGLDTSPMSGVAIQLSQTIPFPGRLVSLGSSAEKATEVRARELELLEARIVEGVRVAFWRLYFAEQAESITRRSADVLDTLANVANARLSVAQAAQQDALQAQVAHSTVRAVLDERKQAVVSARRTLNAAAGRAPVASIGPIGDRVKRLPRLLRKEIVDRAKGSSPLNRLSRSRVDLTAARLDTAEWERWPNFGITGAYRIRAEVPGDPTGGADMFSVGLGVTLPIWIGWKQNALVREREQQRLAAHAAAEDVALDVATRLERAIDVADRLDDEIALYDRELLPQSHQALDASIADYQVARVGFVSVLQNWKTLLDLQVRRERLVSERGEVAARIDTLVGRKLK